MNYCLRQAQERDFLSAVVSKALWSNPSEPSHEFPTEILLYEGNFVHWVSIFYHFFLINLFIEIFVPPF